MSLCQLERYGNPHIYGIACPCVANLNRDFTPARDGLCEDDRNGLDRWVKGEVESLLSDLDLAVQKYQTAQRDEDRHQLRIIAERSSCENARVTPGLLVVERLFHGASISRTIGRSRSSVGQGGQFPEFSDGNSDCFVERRNIVAEHFQDADQVGSCSGRCG